MSTCISNLCVFKLRLLITAIFSLTTLSCSGPSPDLPGPSSYANGNLTNTPNIEDYKTISISPSVGGETLKFKMRFLKENGTFQVQDAKGDSTLYVNPNRCLDAEDPSCKRKFSITGDLWYSPSTSIRCFVQIRNDVNEGYQNQSFAGTCQDRFNRSFGAVISK